MFQLVFNLLETFVKEEALEEVTPARFNKIIFAQKHLNVDIGFVANKILPDLKHKKKISEKDCYPVKADTKTILITLVEKLLIVKSTSQVWPGKDLRMAASLANL